MIRVWTRKSLFLSFSFRNNRFDLETQFEHTEKLDSPAVKNNSPHLPSFSRVMEGTSNWSTMSQFHGKIKVTYCNKTKCYVII
jgi:hypothetical protein